jgi:NTE family protein
MMGNGTKPEPGIGLALSGGGFRATLFHLGTVWRLNELGWLPKLTRITSVSGGSITSGVLGHHWKNLIFDDSGVATNVIDEVAEPLRGFCKRNIDVSSGVAGLIRPFRSISQMVASKYRKYLFGDATLQDFPSDSEGPRFILYATSLQTGASFRFSKPYMADYKVGRVDSPEVSLATAVAASSAFPPALSPVVLKADGYKWTPMKGADLFKDENFRSRLYLTDGGVYDNLGLEVLWDRYQTVLVSDAGAPLGTLAKPSKLWLSQTVRVLGIISEQTRALRKRRLVGDYIAKVRGGAYWGIASHADDYRLADAIIKDNDLTLSLKRIRTRLNKFSDKEQGHLINWGYALTDTAMRKHVLPGETQPGSWPDLKFPLD